MRQIVFSVGERKRRVLVTRIAVGDGHIRCCLGGLDRGFVAGKSDDVLVKVIEPRAQESRIVTLGIGSHEDYLHPVRNIGRQCPKGRGDNSHVHGTDVGTMRISKKENGDVTLSL